MKNNIYPNSPLNLRPVQASKLLPVIYSSMLPDVRCRDLSRTGTPVRTFPWHIDIWYGMHSRLACAEGSGHPLRERFSAVPLPSSDPDRELHLKETVYKDVWDCHLIHWNLRSPRSCPDTLLQFCQKCDGQPTGHGQ